MESYCPECHRTFEMSAGVCPFDETELLSDARNDPYIGTVLDDRYRLDSRVAGGGMGVVYRAKQLTVDRDVAVKLLHSEADNIDAAHRRFTQEARHISQLSHPNIVQMIDFGRDSEIDIWFLVMEYVEGRSLRSLITGRQVDYELALEIIYQVCAALSESHDRDTVHRDLKPENLHLVPIADGTLQVKVLDFGIAECVEKAGRLTQNGQMCGSPAYVAPEQAAGGTVGLRADFFSLGVMLFEMLTGRLPFDAEEPLEYMYQTVNEPFPKLEEELPDTEPVASIQELLDDLVAPVPEDRPESAAAIRERIEELREQFDLPLHRLGTDVSASEDLYPFLDPPPNASDAPSPIGPRPEPSVAHMTATGAHPTIESDAEPGEGRDTVRDLPSSPDRDTIPTETPPGLDADDTIEDSSPMEIAGESDAKEDEEPGEIRETSLSVADLESTWTGRGVLGAAAILIGFGIGAVIVYTGDPDASSGDAAPPSSSQTAAAAADPDTGPGGRTPGSEATPSAEEEDTGGSRAAPGSARRRDGRDAGVVAAESEAETPDDRSGADEGPDSENGAASGTAARSSDRETDDDRRSPESSSRTAPADPEETSEMPLKEMLENGTLRRER